MAGSCLLGALKSRRQLLADGALDDPRPREPDEGFGLGDVHVADEREAGRHAASRRIEQDAYVGQLGGTVAFEGGDRLRHLHEREDALLHAGASGRVQQNDRQPLGCRPLEQPRNLLPDHRSHAPAHEPEEEHAEGHVEIEHASPPRHERVLRARRALGRHDAFSVRLAVRKLQRIGRRQPFIPRVEHPPVEKQGAPAVGT